RPGNHCRVEPNAGVVPSSPCTAAVLPRLNKLKYSKSTCAFTRSPMLNRFARRMSIFTNGGAVLMLRAYCAPWPAKLSPSPLNSPSPSKSGPPFRSEPLCQAHVHIHKWRRRVDVARVLRALAGKAQPFAVEQPVTIEVRPAIWPSRVVETALCPEDAGPLDAPG